MPRRSHRRDRGRSPRRPRRRGDHQLRARRGQPRAGRRAAGRRARRRTPRSPRARPPASSAGACRCSGCPSACGPTAPSPTCPTWTARSATAALVPGDQVVAARFAAPEQPWRPRARCSRRRARSRSASPGRPACRGRRPARRRQGRRAADQPGRRGRRTSPPTASTGSSTTSWSPASWRPARTPTRPPPTSSRWPSRRRTPRLSSSVPRRSPSGSRSRTRPSAPADRRRHHHHHRPPGRRQVSTVLTVGVGADLAEQLRAQHTVRWSTSASPSSTRRRWAGRAGSRRPAPPLAVVLGPDVALDRAFAAGRPGRRRRRHQRRPRRRATPMPSSGWPPCAPASGTCSAPTLLPRTSPPCSSAPPSWPGPAPRRRRHAAAPGRPDHRVIVVASPKGGVGKTTVSTNLAIGLAQVRPGIDGDRGPRRAVRRRGQRPGDGARAHAARHRARRGRHRPAGAEDLPRPAPQRPLRHRRQRLAGGR